MNTMKLFSLLFVVLSVDLLSSTAYAGSFTVLDSLEQDMQVRPGDHREDSIMVRNTSDEPVEVVATMIDYSFQADGSNQYSQPGTMARSNAAWIRVSPAQMVIPPRETLAFSYTVDVPVRDDLKGTYWSVIMIAPVVKPYQAEGQKDKIVLGVQTVIRYGVQISTHMTGTGEKQVEIRDKRLVRRNDQPVLEFDLANMGDTLVRPEVWVELFSSDGVPVGRFDGSPKRIYPGCSARFAVTLNGVGPGKYTALMVADLGDDDLIGAQVGLNIE